MLKWTHALRAATVRGIAEVMDSDRAQVTRTVADLRARSVISRANPSDGRAPIIECIEPGRRLMPSIKGIQREAGTRMAAGLSQAEVDRFIDMAEAMANNINADPADDAGEPRMPL